MLDDIKENTMDWADNIRFGHITEDPANKSRFKFAVINDEKGKIQRLMAKGWCLWEGGDGGYVDKIGEVLEKRSAAKTEDEQGAMHASVPVGMAGTNQPCTAYLMFMPIEMYNERVRDVHRSNAQRQISGVTASARATAESKGRGLDRVVREDGHLDINTDVNIINS